LRLFLKAVEQDNDVAVIENEESSIDVAIARGSHLVNALAYMLDELHADAFHPFSAYQARMRASFAPLRQGN